MYPPAAAVAVAAATAATTTTAGDPTSQLDTLPRPLYHNTRLPLYTLLMK